METQVQEILDQWMANVNACDIDAILALYSDDAVLIPTFSNRLIHTREGLREYFTLLGTRRGLGINIRKKTLITQTPGTNLVTASGIYSWRFEVEDELLNFEARFSYVLNPSCSAPIIHHHSSQIPRVL